MKASKKFLAVVLLSGAVLFSSCIGSFRLTGDLYDWNRSVGSKFANELVFLVFCIVPVYEVAVAIDAIVLNSIEFWSGDNPMDASVQTVRGENGEYLVERGAAGYTVTHTATDESIEFRFDADAQSWSVVSGGQSVELFSFVDADHVKMHLPDGTTTEVELSEAGVLAFRDYVGASAPMFAVR